MIFFLIFNLFYDAGKTGANFLKLSIGARATAMGATYTAITDDCDAIFYNPSTTGLFNSFDFSLMFLNLYNKINYSSLSTSLPINNFSLGIGVSLLSFTDEKLIGPGKIVGKYSCNDILFLLNLSFNLYKKFALGTNLKYVASKYDNYYAYSLATDLGVIFKIFDNLNLGASLLHLGTKRRFISYKEMLPLNLRIGISYKIFFTKKIITTLASDLSTYIDQLPSFGVGGEVLLKGIRKEKEHFALRIGYRTNEKIGTFSGFSLGFGYIYQFLENIFLSIDLTYLDYGYLGFSERVSLTFKYLY
ncbi:MAG: PorV/PorQ family protein [candidate division WOR-3 bacterium]|nr:PorV/PorQ family protein [candidate division WOR-3 bacterium]MCX7836897.1 PorV/PorQ family protein [candidate division WOR-3 bacterium]MDW8114272.1 PorV/PorQ family protein [candidate division WOR-3 bacterium]